MSDDDQRITRIADWLAAYADIADDLQAIGVDAAVIHGMYDALGALNRVCVQAITEPSAPAFTPTYAPLPLTLAA